MRTGRDVFTGHGNNEWFVLIELIIITLNTYTVFYVTECVELVMKAAKEKNATWEQMKLTYLLQLRDAIMTVASFHMMRVEVCYRLIEP